MEHKHSLTTCYPVQITFRASCACLEGTYCVRLFKILRFVCNQNRSTGWNMNKSLWILSCSLLLTLPRQTPNQKICPLQGAGSHFVAPSHCPNMPFPIHHVPLSHLAPLFYPEHGVNTFTYLSDHMRVKFQKRAIITLPSDPQTSYASMNLNRVAKHISCLWNAYFYWEGLKLTFTIRNCFLQTIKTMTFLCKPM
jgi:hypothetical protein